MNGLRELKHHFMQQHIYNGNMKRRGEKGAEKIFKEIMAENFPNLVKNSNTYIYAAEQTSKQLNNSSQDKHKEIHSQKHQNQNVESRR